MEQQSLFDAKPSGEPAHSEKCEHCGHVKKTWKKSIISTAVAALVRLVMVYGGKPVHLDKFNVVQKDRNVSQLVFWGLVVPAINDDTGKRASGMWSPTQAGINFVNRKTVIQKYIITIENEFVGFDGEWIGVREALGKRFDYSELMKNNF